MVLAFIASNDSSDALEKFGSEESERARQKEEAKEKALLAYSEALAATEYLEARKGRRALLDLLELLGERYTMNDALKKVIGLDYQELQTAWEADLQRYRPVDR